MCWPSPNLPEGRASNGEFLPTYLRNVPADFTVEAEKVVFVGVLYAWYHPVGEVAVEDGLVGAAALKLWREVLLVVKEKIRLASVLD